MKFDLAVIGGGPGGYTAAAEAARSGLSVVLFEKDALGGTCLNRGCIPAKALLHTAETLSLIRRSPELGIQTEALSYDFSAIHRRKNQVVSSLRLSVEKMLRSAGVQIIAGTARIPSPGTIECGGAFFEAGSILVATGSVPSRPPIPGASLPGVSTSDDLLEGEGREFRSLVIIGGGVIGVELASFYLPLGCRVTILEAEPHILPRMDREIALHLTAELKKQGARIADHVQVRSVSGTPGCMTVVYTDRRGKELSVQAEGVLMAAGRRADLDGVFPSDFRPALKSGAGDTDRYGRTNLPNLYVIGDAGAGSVQLAHAAMAQGENAAALLSGRTPSADLSLIPSCVYTSPEIASVGQTETEAAAAGIPVRTGKCVTGANGKCLVEGAAGGYLKLVAEADSLRILGAQLVCPRATDLIGELTLTIQKGITAEELLEVVHPHPTFCEMISQAARALLPPSGSRGR